jgi:hypothetical protein
MLCGIWKIPYITGNIIIESYGTRLQISFPQAAKGEATRHLKEAFRTHENYRLRCRLLSRSLPLPGGVIRQRSDSKVDSNEPEYL